jgi:electron transfer flavoprotein alpha subunit
MVQVALSGPVVVTVQPGLAAPESHEHGTGPAPEVVEAVPAGHRDAEVVELLGPDVATMDLAEAPRLVGGGAGLDSSERFGELAELAELIGAAMGATRVVTDRGWVGHERQIGTTGVVVDPSLYLAFGISGAVQHTAGLGDPDHIVSVNTEPHCPMMSMADLAIVSDANATVVELLRLLRSEGAAAS